MKSAAISKEADSLVPSSRFYIVLALEIDKIKKHWIGASVLNFYKLCKALVSGAQSVRTLRLSASAAQILIG